MNRSLEGDQAPIETTSLDCKNQERAIVAPTLDLWLLKRYENNLNLKFKIAIFVTFN